MSPAPNVRFLCTGNSARSILAEALLNREGGDQREAFLAAFRALQERIEQLLALPVETMDPTALKRRLSNIGRGETNLA